MPWRMHFSMLDTCLFLLDTSNSNSTVYAYAVFFESGDSALKNLRHLSVLVWHHLTVSIKNADWHIPSSTHVGYIRTRRQKRAVGTYSYEGQLAIFYMHYHIHMTTHDITFDKPVCGTGWASWRDVCSGISNLLKKNTTEGPIRLPLYHPCPLTKLKQHRVCIFFESGDSASENLNAHSPDSPFQDAHDAICLKRNMEP